MRRNGDEKVYRHIWSNTTYDPEELICNSESRFEKVHAGIRKTDAGNVRLRLPYLFDSQEDTVNASGTRVRLVHRQRSIITATYP